MLQYIRDRATGWIAWAIILLIVVTFALWGITDYFTPDQGLVVARVNDTEIGYYQYRNAWQQQRDRLRQMFGGTIPSALLDDASLRRQALEQLIDDEVLVQGAVAGGLRVGDGQLALSIRSLPPFQQGGQFSQAAYDAFLRSRGTSAQGFELDMRRSLLSEQVVSALRRSEIVTGRALDAALEAHTEQRRFRLLRVDPATLQVPAPAEQRIHEWYEANPELYVQPERVKVRYIELSRDAIAAQVTVDEAELKAIYEQRRDSYRTPEQREARHILLTVAADAPADEVAKARAAIDALRARIEAGEDFAEVAKAESQDPGSAPLGGALGAFGRGVMDPAFEDTAFSLAKDALSEPVRTRFGWHLIQVTAIQPEGVRTFEDAREDVAREYRRAQAEQIFAEQVERLVNLGFEHPESLEVAAEALGVTPRTSEFFSRDGAAATGIATEEAVRAAAFGDDVLEAGNNSELIELGSSRVAMLRVIEREPSRPRTLEEVRGEIAALLERKAAEEKAADVGRQVLAALRGGGAPDEVAATHGLSFQPEQTATRDSPGGLSRALAETLFGMPAPSGEEPVYEGVQGAGGGYVVMALLGTARADLDPAEAARTRERIAESLESGYGEQTFSAVMRALRRQADVEILEQNLRPDET